MKKKVPVAVWLIITFVIFALLAWWAYMMLNHVRNDASGAYTITTQVAEGEGTVTPAKEKAGAKEKVDVAIKAGDDFVINTVMAKADDGGDVEISTKDSGGEVFTLVMPDPGQNVTLRCISPRRTAPCRLPPSIPMPPRCITWTWIPASGIPMPSPM